MFGTAKIDDVRSLQSHASSVEEITGFLYNGYEYSSGRGKVL